MKPDQIRWKRLNSRRSGSLADWNRGGAPHEWLHRYRKPDLQELLSFGWNGIVFRVALT